MTTHRFVVALALSAVAGSACHGSTTDVDPLAFPLASADAAPDPSKAGPLPVGVRTIELDDTSRPDMNTKKPRHLKTEIWYPAAESARGQPGATYDLSTLLTADEVAQVKAKNIALPLLETTAVRDAPPRTTHGPYPFVVFSHGHGGIRWQSTFYTVALASHGYVVVSPDHEGDTLGDFLKTQMMTSVLAGVETRPQDVMFLMDYFTTLDPSDPLHGLYDMGHIGVTGHSFGAFTAMRVAAEDPLQRVKAIVPQAPTTSAESLIGFGSDYILQTPTLIEGAGDDHTLPFKDNAQPAYDHVAKPRALLDIIHGGHFTFSDLCKYDLAAIAAAVGFVNVGKVVSDGCGPTAPTAAVAEPIMNNFAIAWFNIHLRGSVKSWDFITQARADSLTSGVATIQVDR